MDNSERLLKHLLIGFGCAVVIYAVFFSCDHGMRQRKGPWEVRFDTNAHGFAAITVNQPRLQVRDVRIEFEGESVTNAPATVAFDKPLKVIPFGKVKFEDLTYLPGSVAFDFFGHEVELLPRTLYLNKQEYPWSGAGLHVLKPEEKLPPEMSYDPREKKRKRRAR